MTTCCNLHNPNQFRLVLVLVAFRSVIAILVTQLAAKDEVQHFPYPRDLRLC